MDKKELLQKCYDFYHKLYICYKWKYKNLKKLKLMLNMSSIILTVTGTVIGGITLNPIILGCITGPGILIQGYISNSNINNKVSMCKFAYTSYEKIVSQITSYRMGMPYDEMIFLSDLKVLDDTIIDLCPTINGMSNRYDKKYVGVNPEKYKKPSVYKPEIIIKPDINPYTTV